MLTILFALRILRVFDYNLQLFKSQHFSESNFEVG